MNAIKYDSGGDFILTKSLYSGSDYSESSNSIKDLFKTADSEDSDSKASDKDLLGIIKEIKGLKSDENAAIARVSQLLMNPAIRNPQNLYQAYLQTVQLVNELERNKKEYENAYDKASKNNGLSEIAIDDRGFIIAYDKSKGPQSITYLPVQTFIADQQNPQTSKYQALTNSDLLNLRDNTDLYTFNNSVFQVVENGIGLDKVTDMIHNVTDKIKSNKLEMSGYSTAQNNTIIKGIDLMKDIAQMPDVGPAMMTLDGVYKSKVISESNKQQIDASLEYIYRTLPNNAKTLLAVKSGNAQDPAAGAKSMIYLLLSSVTQNNITFDPEYQKDLNPDGTKKSDSSNGIENGDYKLNPAERFMIGSGEHVLFDLNFKGTKGNFTLDAIRMAIPDTENKNLGQNCTLNEVSKSLMGGALDFNSIYASNGAKLSPNATSEMLVNDGNIYSLDLPYVRDEVGNIHPDYDLLDKIDAVNKQAKEEGVDPTNPDNREKMNEYYKDAELPVLYRKDPNTGEWVLNTDQYMRFAAFNCTVLSTAFENDPSFNIDEIDNDDEIEQVLNILKQKNGGEKVNFDENNWYDWNGHDDMYRVSVFIPMSENLLSVQGGKNVEANTQIALEAQTKHAEIQRGYINPNDIK